MNKEHIQAIQKELDGSGLKIYVFDPQTEETGILLDLEPVPDSYFESILDRAKYVAHAKDGGYADPFARDEVDKGEEHVTYQIS